MEATVDKKTGKVTIRLSRILSLLEEFDTGTVRDFADVARRVLESEGDPAFEFYSTRIWPHLRGLVPFLFFRESMGEFFLELLDSGPRRTAASIVDEDADLLRSIFGAGCAPETVLDTLFFSIGELDFSPDTAGGLRPLSIVNRQKDPAADECLDVQLSVSVVIPLLENCRSMLGDPSPLDGLIDELSRSIDGVITLRILVNMLNEAYGDPSAVSTGDILTVRERIIEILPLFAMYPPGTEHTAPDDIHHEVTVTDRGGTCDDVRLSVPPAPTEQPDELPCPVAVGETIAPPVGSRVEALDDILHEHPRWSIQVPAGTHGAVTHIDDRGRRRIRWEEFEWPRFPLPLPGEPPRRGYEVRSFPLESSQFGMVKVLDNAFVLTPEALDSCGRPTSAADCVKEAADCLLKKLECLVFDNEFDLCPLPYRLRHRLCVSCGVRLDLYGSRFAAAVASRLDWLIRESATLSRKITERFTDDFVEAKLDGSFMRSVRTWRGFRTASRIVVQGDSLCAVWSIPNVRPPQPANPPQCEEKTRCSAPTEAFPAHDELLQAIEMYGPDSPEAFGFAQEIAADVFRNLQCCCTTFEIQPGGGGMLGFQWTLDSTYDLEPYGVAFAGVVVDAVRDMLVCDPAAARKKFEEAREGLYSSRIEIGSPPALAEVWDDSCGDPGNPNPDAVVEFLAPWIDPDLMDGRRWTLAFPELNDQIAGLTVQQNLSGDPNILTSVAIRATDGRVPTGSDLFVRLENIDTGERADASLRIGEEERSTAFAVPFSPGDRMSGVVLVGDSSSIAANIEVEAEFEEADGGVSSVAYFIPTPSEGEHFVGQTDFDSLGRDFTVTTVCVDLAATPVDDLVLRLENLDVPSATVDVTVGAGTLTASYPVSIPLLPGERLSVRLLDAFEPAPGIAVTVLGRVGADSDPTGRTVARSFSSSAPTDGQVLVGLPFQVVRISDGSVVAKGFADRDSAEAWLVANSDSLDPPDPALYEVREGLGGQPPNTAQPVPVGRMSASPAPAGRAVEVSVRNLTTTASSPSSLPAGQAGSTSSAALKFSAGDLLEVVVTQSDDGIVTQSVNFPEEPVSTAPAPLRDTMWLYSEDSPPLPGGSEILAATLTAERPPIGTTLTVRFEDIDSGEHEDISLPPPATTATATIGFAIRDGHRLRVTLLRAGFGAAGLTVSWERQMVPAGNLVVELVSDVDAPAPEADSSSCDTFTDLKAFVEQECAAAADPASFASDLGREFGWPFATRLAVDGLLIWDVIAGWNVVSVDGDTITLLAVHAHDDLTPEFLAALETPECPTAEEPPERCELEEMLLEGRIGEVADRVAGSLADSLKFLRFEVRSLGDDDGVGLVVCVRTGEDICFDDESAIGAILDRFAELLGGDRAAALRKAVEYVNDLRDAKRIPSQPDPLTGLIPPAVRLPNPRLTSSYLLAALLSRDPLLSRTDGGTSFVFFGGGRSSAPTGGG